MPELKLYTVAQLRAWVMHNHAAEGLTEQVIAPSRAWAIVNNPYVKDNDPVVAAIFEDGKNVAYVSAFPELIDGKRYWWFSSLWCNPACQGNGYGLIVIGSLAEVYGVECCLDRWGAKETIEIFSYFGHRTVETSRYILGAKINHTSKKGTLVSFAHSVQKCLHKLIEHSIQQEAYMLQYMPYIDEATYDFITRNRGSNYFLHTQDFMNWVMRYSFTVSAPLIEYVKITQPFARAEKGSTKMYAVQVLNREKIIGFYLIKQNDSILHILYLYYDIVYMTKVFASIRDHITQMHIEQCSTESKELAEYLRSQVYFPKYSEVDISFSFPEMMPQPALGSMQYGDGDCFVV